MQGELICEHVEERLSRNVEISLRDGISICVGPSDLDEFFALDTISF